ncbi:Prenylcysteine lyase-domain-containing protein [Powellomyces hirtus]|nr:Prenylcysteine lyase-domain-containing protein [Powellomyces hirtus]
MHVPARTFSFLAAFLLLVLQTTAHRAEQHPLHLSNDDAPPKRVAVIGAGAAGTAFSYFLRQAVPEHLAHISIFEASERVGGRASAVHFDGADIEIGASIFLKENENLYNATRRFNLTLRNDDDDDHSGEKWGIWSPISRGFQFISSTNAKLTMAKLIWRYGVYAPYQTAKLARQAAAAFGRGAYSIPAVTPTPPTLAALISDFNLEPYANQSGRAYLGVKDLYLDEIVGAAVRVNYGQDLSNEMTALPPLISMAAATGEATAVKGGNQQIFEHFAVSAEASLHLGQRVTRIERSSSSTNSDDGAPLSSVQYAVTTSNGKTAFFDAVAVAVPFTDATKNPIEFRNLAKGPTKHPYIHLHVTLVAGTAPNPDHFGASPPTRILTSSATSPSDMEDPFNSISHLGNGTYKIFSRAPPTDQQLRMWFDPLPDRVARYEWDAYPQFRKGDGSGRDDHEPVLLDERVYYLNAFEHVFSTMESQTAVGRRIAASVAHWILN